MSRKNKMGKALSAALSISMLFGMSLSAVKAEDIVVVSQDFENVASATDAGWSWNVYEPTIEANVGDNATNALKLGPNDDAGSKMIYGFEPTDRFTLKMKLYMEDANTNAYIRLVNTNTDNTNYIDIMTLGWEQIIWQENANNVGQYNIGWNDVEITVDPVQKTYSFKVNDITFDEVEAYNLAFFDYNITSLEVLKGGKTATVAVDDFSITQNSGNFTKKDIVAMQNFDSLSATDVTAGNSNDNWCSLNDNSYLMAYAKCATISMSGGIADKAADDKCVVINGENIAKSNGTDPFVSLISDAEGNSVTTLDFKLHIDGNINTYIQALDSEKTSLYQILFWNDDDTVYLYEDMQKYTAVPNFSWKSEMAESKWMDVSISVDTKLNTTTLIINNKIVGKIPNAGSISGYKFISGYSADGQSGTLAIDDLNFYEKLSEEESPEAPTFGNIDVQVENGAYVAKLDVTSDEELPIMLAIAAYDANDQLINIGVEKSSVQGTTTVEKSITLGTTASKIKAFAWNPDTLKPYVNCGVMSIPVE